MISAMPLLAQSDSSLGDVFFWGLLLMVLVVALFAAVAVLRKKLSPNEDFHGAGFTLSDLRQMHKKGQMSDEEFERAKIALLGAMKNMPAKTADAVQPKDFHPPS
jgi:hypothetical protein